jgi:hypothetical protein
MRLSGRGKIQMKDILRKKARSEDLAITFYLVRETGFGSSLFQVGRGNSDLKLSLPATR